MNPVTESNTMPELTIATVWPVIVVTAVVVAIISWIIWRLKQRYQDNPGGDDKLATALRDEKLKSSIIVSAIEDGVALFDEQQIIRSFNPAAGKISGWAPEEAMNLDFGTVIRVVNEKGEPFPPDLDPFKRAFNEKTTIRTNDAELVTKGNKRVPVNLSISPLVEDDKVTGKKVFAAVAVFRDVTQERAEESQRAEFISTASHEMRTPVAAIEGYLALALNDKVSTIDSRARDYLEKAHSSTQHLGKLFQDLLTSAKAEDGRLTSHPTVVEMGELLQQLTEDLRFAAEKKNLGMEFAIGAGSVINATDTAAGNGKVVRPLYYTTADADRLREVITNLFDNAVKYTESGKISIGLTGNNEVVQLYVRDTGSGIPSEDLPHLFQKFYRVDNSATRTIGGTGLGLFISRKIVELYSGKIWVESKMGQGSTFFINFPRLTTQQATDMKAKQSTASNLPAINSLATS
jgi:two-component system, OmpR family, sensor histidine kinase VicK